MSLSPEATASWLTLAYGQVKAELILGMPADLQLALWEAVLTFGPAGEEIVELLKAVEAVGDSVRIGFLVATELLYLNENGQDAFLPVNYAPFRVSDQVNPDLFSVEENLRWASKTAILEQSWGNGETILLKHGVSELVLLRRGLRCLAWMLNAQYAGFEEVVLPVDLHYVVTANQLLVRLGLQPLRGRFAEAGGS